MSGICSRCKGDGVFCDEHGQITCGLCGGSGKSAECATYTVLDEVRTERLRQHGKWDGVFDDRSYTPLDWHEMIADYNGWARRMACMGSIDKARTRYIQIAALAVAAVEAMDSIRATSKKG